MFRLAVTNEIFNMSHFRLSPVRLARLGHRVFIPATGVRIPYGTPFLHRMVWVAVKL
jgi:hypothetical protein